MIKKIVKFFESPVKEGTRIIIITGVFVRVSNSYWFGDHSEF